MIASPPVPLTAQAQALRDGFLRWQCRIRQMSMRDEQGRPGDGVMPAVTLAGESEPLGHIITVLNKMPGQAITPELRHMAQKTNDPAQIRESALRLFSETYYQKGETFTDMLTATFPSGSPGARQIREAERCTLTFEAYRQRYDLSCRVWSLAEKNPIFQATYWHNYLFNPALTPDCVILAFEPDWEASDADPVPGAR